MKFSLSIFVLLMIFNVRLVYGQRYAYHPKYITLLDSSKGRKCLHQCSRGVPENITGFFNISKPDSLKVITNFKKVLLIHASGNNLAGNRLHLNDFNFLCFQLL